MNSGKSNRRWIGIDGGGTKTNCIIGDENGRILSMAIGTSSNIQSVNHQKVCANLFYLINSVLIDSNSSIDSVETIYLCLAGADREKDKTIIRGFFEGTPYAKKILIGSDALAALASGTWGEDGLLLIAGTGSIAYGITKENANPIRVGGWGYLLGDEGSGFYIGREAVTAVLRAFDHRGPQTVLTERILKHFQLQEVSELIALYREETMVPKIAGLSKYVFEAAKDGDGVALSILNGAIDHLAKMVEVALSKLNSKEKVPLVLHGGLFSDEQFSESLKAKLQETLGGLTIVQPEIPAVVGAYLLALKNSKHTIDEKVQRNVQVSWKELTQTSK